MNSSIITFFFFKKKNAYHQF